MSPVPSASDRPVSSNEPPLAINPSSSSSFAPPFSTSKRTLKAARIGQPASNRNFAVSSAGGVPQQSSSSSSSSGRRKGAAPHAVSGNANGEGEADEGDDDDDDSRKRKKQVWGEAYLMREETIRNDYSTRFVETRERPQNHIRGAAVEDRFAEYPKLSRLLDLKHSLTASPEYSIPPTYTNDHPSTLSLPNLKFDSILLTPRPETTYEELLSLPLAKWASNPSFVWIWVGSGQRGDGVGLEMGRELLSRWGYRRCEDLVWLKTNPVAKGGEVDENVKKEKPLFESSIEHCLMGIRGTVRRSTDPWFVHCNVDTDVMVWEGDEEDPQLKPPELQTLVESFCLGTRRLHLYGSPHSLRRGWLTVAAPNVEFTPDSSVRKVEREKTHWVPKEFVEEEFIGRFDRGGSVNGTVRALEAMAIGESSEEKCDTTVKRVPLLLPFAEELDSLRPKSPPRREGQPSSGGLGRGRGAGLGVTRSLAAANPPLLQNGHYQSSGAGRGRGRGRGQIPPAQYVSEPVQAAGGGATFLPRHGHLPLPFQPQPFFIHQNPSFPNQPVQHQQPNPNLQGFVVPNIQTSRHYQPPSQMVQAPITGSGRTRFDIRFQHQQQGSMHPMQAQHSPHPQYPPAFQYQHQHLQQQHHFQPRSPQPQSMSHFQSHHIQHHQQPNPYHNNGYPHPASLPHLPIAQPVLNPYSSLLTSSDAFYPLGDKDPRMSHIPAQDLVYPISGSGIRNVEEGNGGTDGRFEDS